MLPALGARDSGPMTGADAGSDACASFVSLRPFVSSLNSRSARPVLLPKPASRVPPKISKITARMISSSHTPSPKTSGVMSTSFSADDRQLVDILLRKTCYVVPANRVIAVGVIAVGVIAVGVTVVAVVVVVVVVAVVVVAVVVVLVVVVVVAVGVTVVVVVSWRQRSHSQRKR